MHCRLLKGMDAVTQTFGVETSANDNKVVCTGVSVNDSTSKPNISNTKVFENVFELLRHGLRVDLFPVDALRNKNQWPRNLLIQRNDMAYGRDGTSATGDEGQLEAEKQSKRQEAQVEVFNAVLLLMIIMLMKLREVVSGEEWWFVTSMVDAYCT